MKSKKQFPNERYLENDLFVLKNIVSDLHWMARRYADGRASYATSMFNDATRKLLRMGVRLNPTTDGKLFADDRMGPAFSGITPEDLETERKYVEAQREKDDQDGKPRASEKMEANRKKI